MDNVSFSYNLAKEDFYSFHLWEKYGLNYLPVFNALAKALLPLAVIILLLITGYWEWWILLLLVGGLLPLIDKVISYLIILGKSDKDFKSQKIGSSSLDISDAGITLSSVAEQRNLSWENIAKIVETDKLFIFYQTKNNKFFFPKTAFTNQEIKIKQLKKIIWENAGDRAEFWD